MTRMKKHLQLNIDLAQEVQGVITVVSLVTYNGTVLNELEARRN